MIARTDKERESNHKNALNFVLLLISISRNEVIKITVITYKTCDSRLSPKEMHVGKYGFAIKCK